MQSATSRLGSAGLRTAAPSEPAHDDGGPRQYDFRRPGKFTKDQLRTLHVVHETYARLLSTYLAAQFRAPVQIELTRLEQVAYGEYMATVATPANLLLVSFKPLGGQAVLRLDHAVVFPMLDRLFGGDGVGVQEKPRALTDLETPVVLRVWSQSLAYLAEAWRQIVALSLRVEGFETNPVFVQLAPQGEMCILLTWNLRLQGNSGEISLCMPHSLLEPILDKLSAQVWIGVADGDGDAGAESVQAELEEAELPLVVLLGSAQLRLRDILELDRGDVVVLEQTVGSALQIKVGDRLAFAGRPGTLRGNMAVEITGLCPVGGDEDD